MASYDPQDFGFDEPPARPTTPPVRRGFLVVLVVLCLLASLVHGIPYMAERTGYAWEAGRSRAASEALAKLDEAGIIDRASALFRMATTAVAPAVVRVQTQRFPKGNGEAADVLGKGRRSTESLGSGVVIDKDRGFVVTNHHVVKDADVIEVRLSEGTVLSARLLGEDPKSDLAVLKVKGTFPVAAQWGDSDKLDIGEWVLAIGSPYAFDQTVTAGIVSATQRHNLLINEYESYIQTDAAINPGNSGGPLIDLTGKVVGINTAIYTTNQGQGNEGIGLAIPSSMARRVVESLIKEGRVVRGYLGVEIQPITPPIAKALALPDTRGALVKSVRPDSPAAQAGLIEGDVIVKLAGKEVADPATLRIVTADLAVGKSAPLDLYREGKLKRVEVLIGELPGMPVQAAFGLHFREVTPAEEANAGPGLEIEHVDPGSNAARSGFQPGMKILFVGKTPVRSKADFEAAAAKLDPAGGLPLVVKTPDGRTGSVTIGGPPPGRP